MADIELYYTPENFAKVALGTKCCTSRHKRYGKVGDTLISRMEKANCIVGIQSIITTQVRTSIEKVARHLYRQEGAYSPDDFRIGYLAIKNKGRERWGFKATIFHPDEMVWVHWFWRKPMPLSLIRKLAVPGMKVSRTKQRTLDDVVPTA